MSLSKDKILVALSGGVDSAVAASVLLKSGHEVETVYVKTWEHEEDLLGDCPGAQDLKDARSVATEDSFQNSESGRFYRQNVVSPMIDGYASGITPNPDVLCNREMKFGELLDYARKEGFSRLATGHYCRKYISSSGEINFGRERIRIKTNPTFFPVLLENN